MNPLGLKEVKKIVERLKTEISPDTSRMIQGWIRQRIVLKYLFALFRKDEYGELRSRGDSVRNDNLDAAKKSVHMEDKK